MFFFFFFFFIFFIAAVESRAMLIECVVGEPNLQPVVLDREPVEGQVCD